MDAPTPAVFSERVAAAHGAYRWLASAPPEESARAIALELAQLVGWASQESPWWRARLKTARGLVSDANLPVTEVLAAIPVMSPRELHDHYAEMAIDLPDSVESDYRIRLTSGYSSQPRRIRQHVDTSDVDAIANFLLLAEWHGLDAQGTIVFLDGNVPTSGDRVPLGTPWSFLNPAASGYVRRTHEHSPDELLDLIASVQPRTIATTAMTLRHLASTALARGGNPAIARPREVLAFAGPVDGSLRHMVREAFGCPVIDTYSCTEVGQIAQQCPDPTHLHVVPNVLVEVVDSDGRPCPVGQPGRVLVTSLHSFAMPIIRYELGDLATRGAPCAEGITLPVLESVDGRIQSTVTLDDGQVWQVHFGSADLLAIPALLDFRVIAYTDVCVLLVNAARPFTLTETERASAAVRAAVRLDLPVRVVFAEDRYWQGSLKQRDFERVDAPAPDPLTFVSVRRTLTAAPSRSDDQQQT